MVYVFLVLYLIFRYSLGLQALAGGGDGVGWLSSSKQASKQAKQANATAMDLRERKVLLYLLTHLSPRMCLDLGKLELGVVGVHLSDLLSGWGAQNLEDTQHTRPNTSL